MSESNKVKILCVRVQEDLYQDLRKIAFKRYNTFHGALARAVRDALREYIEKHSKELG